MIRKDYQLIAEAVNTGKDKKEIIQNLAKDNERFNKEKFINACKGE